MSRHIRTKHGAPGGVAREYPCSKQGCGKIFRRNDAKLNHERKEHPELGRLSAVPRKPLNQDQKEHPELGYLSEVPRKPLNQAATRNLGISTPQQ